MSHVYKALRQAEAEISGNSGLADAAVVPRDLLQMVGSEDSWLEQATVVKASTRPEDRVVTISDGNSLAAEKFRLLRARLRHLQDKRELKKVVITSGLPAEGKTTVASNLAVSLSRHTPQKVLLLEGDLRHPALTTQFGLRGLPGLSEWFQGEDPITQYVCRIHGLQLWFLPAGSAMEDPLKVLQSARFVEALNRLAGSFDWIIIDAPPLAPLADIHLWAEQADGVLLVVRQGKTSKKTLVKGLNGLDGAKLVGVVFNDTQSAQRDYYQKYYRSDGAVNGSGKKNGKAKTAKA